MPKGNYDIFVLALELETVKKRVLKRWGVKWSVWLVLEMVFMFIMGSLYVTNIFRSK
jgi:hypothetical protein